MKKVTLFTICNVLMFSAFTATSQIITTVAGTGVLGYSGDGGQASAAELRNPNCIAFDLSGNYYIGDETSNVVRMVNPLGIIKTVAGIGIGGYSGNGGQATAAELSDPIGVVIDANGNIYIGELSNHTVRKVTKSTGIITTIAGTGTAGFSGDGGQATAAKLNQPRYIALDKNGNIFIADANNNRIREITVSSGIINTVVGNGTASFSGDGGPALSAELNYPYGVALDDSANIYIADQNNNRIREVRELTGIITTIAGNGFQGFSGDGGSATAAELYSPDALTVAYNGDVFISVTQGQTIRKVLRSTSIISDFAGNNVAGFYGDGGLATAAELHFPAGITIAPNGSMYVPDWGNARVRRITNAETTAIQAINNPSDKGINVYPNPANQQVFVAFNGIEGKVTVTLYNIIGQQVLSKNTDAKQPYMLNTSSLERGTYVIKIQSEDGNSYVRKIELTR